MKLKLNTQHWAWPQPLCDIGKRKMITQEKLRIFLKYNGDIDLLVRGGRKQEKGLFNDDEWSLIDDLQQRLELTEKGLASPEFTEATLEKLRIVTDSVTYKFLTKKITDKKEKRPHNNA